LKYVLLMLYLASVVVRAHDEDNVKNSWYSGWWDDSEDSDEYSRSSTRSISASRTPSKSLTSTKSKSKSITASISVSPGPPVCNLEHCGITFNEELVSTMRSIRIDHISSGVDHDFEPRSYEISEIVPDDPDVVTNSTDKEDFFDADLEYDAAMNDNEKGLLKAGVDPTRIYVESMSFGGSGCPRGSVATALAVDRQSFTLSFDTYFANSGPGVQITQTRKNCQLNINLHIPQGFSYSIATFDYRGFAQLPAGVRAEQKSTYYFEGEVTQASGISSITGPDERDYLSRDILAAVAWMPSCNRVVVPLNINTQIRLVGDLSKAAMMTTDSIDAKVTQVLGFKWQNC